MAKYLLTDGSVTVNSVDLSDHAFSLDTPFTREQVDVSGFSPTQSKEFLPGSKDERITVGFLQDFAANKVDQTLYPLYANGTVFAISVKPTSAATSASNPSYGGSVALFDYNPLSGELNARGESQVTFIAATSSGITRGTS